MYGTGRIGEIIDSLESIHGQKVSKLDVDTKLHALTESLGLSVSDFDALIAMNPPVLRTVKGHAFESFFDALLRKSGANVKEIGGDNAVDREVNGFTLQLKTPNLTGTKNGFVEYKTHKTHGAKSERESIDYYHRVSHFADYLVGLISYKPLEIIFISQEELPRTTASSLHIKSPFRVLKEQHPGVNAFHRIGVQHPDQDEGVFFQAGNELLPLTAQSIGVSSEIIIDTIMKKDNFRIWDMSIRGFAKEMSFTQYFASIGIELKDPKITGRDRFEKADFVFKDGFGYKFIQMKGVSTNNCSFDILDPIVAIETQLTRGRINDHPTQSRLYLRSDFDYLALALDPPLVQTCRKGKFNNTSEFYLIPSDRLMPHKTMGHRFNAIQKFSYSSLQEFKV
ncbi:hypothetical protein VSAK1_09113 [Vibrio mediterranei AK1]|uniref:hypothetical protein n=1 Tax=Vibrio mediterranei TaxID=689 RepID=UPI000154275D|nr:hypothetical protein [Vibrio mediterranei]EDL51441.1 hypothetical protein VSAK1_09113 [Vibrio mediterranei AK1]